jgi:hypothetical protein
VLVGILAYGVWSSGVGLLSRATLTFTERLAGAPGAPLKKASRAAMRDSLVQPSAEASSGDAERTKAKTLRIAIMSNDCNV